MFLPPTDHKQDVILQRFYMACACYVFTFVLLGIARFSNLPNTHFEQFLPLLVVFAFLQLLFFIAIRFGFSRRFADPAMTTTQIVTGIVCMGVLMHMGGHEYRSVIMHGYIIVVLFGVFYLSSFNFAIISIASILSYMLATISIVYRDGMFYSVSFEVAQFSVFSVVMLFALYLGGYQARLRTKLSEQRKGLLESHLRITEQNNALEHSQQELQQALRKLAELAAKDDLTGLDNRRHFDEILKSQIDRAQALGTSLGLLMMDLDYFKQVNDKYGHGAGDAVLSAFSALGPSCLRRSDFFARYGGEEFVVLLPETTPETLLECAERIRRFTDALHFEQIDPALRVTVSIGATLYHRNESIVDFMARADKALYDAKKQGRNRVIFVS